MTGFLSGCVPYSCSLSICSRSFLFLEGACSETFNFFFFRLLSHYPLCTTWGSRASVVPPLPWGYQTHLFGASLLLPGIHSVRFIHFGFFAGGSAPTSLGVLGHTCLACPWRSLVWFLSSLRALSGTLSGLSHYQGDTILWESSMDSHTAWYWNNHLGWVFLLTLFIDFSWKDWLTLTMLLQNLSVLIVPL